MKQILLLTTVSFISLSLNAQDVIKETYKDEFNAQTTVIIKDSTSTDVDVLKELDLDEYTVGQEVRITEDMIAELNRRERMRAQAFNNPNDDIPDLDELEVLEIGVITPSSRLEVSSDEDEEMIFLDEFRGEGEGIFIRRNPTPTKFLELIKTEEYQEKLKRLKSEKELIFA